MNSFATTALRILKAAFAALLVTGSASAAQIWVAPAAQKIRPAVQVPAGAAATAKIAAAKNEFESFQVVVGGDGAAGMWPDALIPDVDPIAGEKRNAFPFDVPAGESRAVLVDIHAPQGTPAGTYTGVLHVTGGATQDVAISLTVWDFEIPSTSTLKSAFGLAWNGPCRGHGDPGCTGGAADMALRARYVQSALDNHVSIHQPYYTATVDGAGNPNWGAFDLYAGPFLDGTAHTRLPGAKLTSVSVNGPSTAPQVSAWGSHFKAKGWTSTTLFDYVCDEPPLTCAWSDINARIAASHSGDATVPTLVTTTTAQAQQQGVSGIDLFVPVINFVEGKPGTQFAGNQRSKYGANAWWYQSCMSFGCSGVGGGLDGTGETGWPTMAIDADATRNRAMEWLSFSYGMQGELYYETTTAFAGDPWVSQYAFGGSGDGTLFYPGTTAKIGGQTEIPVESLRLKAIRDGMEDQRCAGSARADRRRPCDPVRDHRLHHPDLAGLGGDGKHRRDRRLSCGRRLLELGRPDHVARHPAAGAVRAGPAQKGREALRHLRPEVAPLGAATAARLAHRGAAGLVVQRRRQVRDAHPSSFHRATASRKSRSAPAASSRASCSAMPSCRISDTGV